MGKYIWILILAFISCKSKDTTHITPTSTHLPEDSLLNYSYMLTQMDNDSVIGSGTGEIIHYAEKYYLVTNFHVLTGRDAKTNSNFKDSRGTVSDIAMVFQPKDNKSAFVPMVYPIYNSEGEDNFQVLKFNNQLIDIAVMPIVLPDKAAHYFFEITDLDTSTSYDSTSRLIFLGFPNGEFINTWQPTKRETRGVINPQKDHFDPFVFIDSSPIIGMSGGALYKSDSYGGYRFFGVISNKVDYTKEAPKMQGRAVQIKWTLELIRKMQIENKQAIIGVEYIGK